jgi:exonuclease III
MSGDVHPNPGPGDFNQLYTPPSEPPACDMLSPFTADQEQSMLHSVEYHGAKLLPLIDHLLQNSTPAANVGQAIYQALQTLLPVHKRYSLELQLHTTHLQQVLSTHPDYIQTAAAAMPPLPSAPHTTPAQQDETFQILTWNVNGLFDKLQDITDLVSTSQPDVLLLQETHTRQQQHTHSSLKRALPQYTVLLSSAPVKDTLNQNAITVEGLRTTTRARAGMLIAIKKRITHSGMLQRHNNKIVHGFLMHVSITAPASTPIHIISVYMAVTTADNSTRTSCYQYIADTIARHPEAKLIIAGDWNAVHHATDRSSGELNTLDQRHINFVHQHQLSLALPPGPMRAHSYHRAPISSRIDDIYIRNMQSVQHHLHAMPQHQVINTVHSARTDHMPIHCTFPAHLVFNALPQPNPTTHQRTFTPTIILPLQRDTLNKFCSAVTAQCQHELDHAETCIHNALAHQTDTEATHTAHEAFQQAIDAVYAFAYRLSQPPSQGQVIASRHEVTNALSCPEHRQLNTTDTAHA